MMDDVEMLNRYGQEMGDLAEYFHAVELVALSVPKYDELIGAHDAT